jgi:hypothetical protein
MSMSHVQNEGRAVPGLIAGPALTLQIALVAMC